MFGCVSRAMTFASRTKRESPVALAACSGSSIFTAT